MGLGPAEYLFKVGKEFRLESNDVNGGHMAAHFPFKWCPEWEGMYPAFYKEMRRLIWVAVEEHRHQVRIVREMDEGYNVFKAVLVN